MPGTAGALPRWPLLPRYRRECCPLLVGKYVVLILAGAVDLQFTSSYLQSDCRDRWRYSKSGISLVTKIHRVNLTKSKLAAMPQAERSLLLLLGHANNEINVLSKLILMLRKDEPEVKLIDHVEAGQVFIIMRVLIGKLHEAWLLFNRRFQSDHSLRRKYLTKLSSGATTAVTELNHHFGRRSPLTAIRNAVSFHYADEKNLVEENFRRLPETEPWEFYLSRTVGNSFYFASELVIDRGVIRLAMGKSEAGAAQGDLSLDAAAFVNLCDTVIKVSGSITELFGDLIGLIVMTSIGEDVETSTIEIPDGPKISAFSLPYFFDENDALPAPKDAV
jgi:hypothetical protein